MPAWVAEREVHDESVAEAIVARHPHLAGSPVRRVGQGWDNVVIAIGPLFVRIAVRASGDALMRREWTTLRHLHDLPVRTPRMVDHGEPEPGLVGPWMLYRPVPGEEVAGRLARGHGLAEPERLGHALSVLHRADRVCSLRSVLPDDPLRRADPVDLHRRVCAWRDRACAAGLDVPVEALDQLLAATERGPVALPPAIVHGDLHLRHVLVDEEGRCTGLIDWGDACVAPPVGDVSVFWWGLLPEQRRDFIDGYGPIDEATLAAARRFAAFSCLALLAASADLGDEQVAAAARTGLQRVLMEAW